MIQAAPPSFSHKMIRSTPEYEYVHTRLHPISLKIQHHSFVVLYVDYFKLLGLWEGEDIHSPSYCIYHEESIVDIANYSNYSVLHIMMRGWLRRVSSMQ